MPPYTNNGAAMAVNTAKSNLETRGSQIDTELIRARESIAYLNERIELLLNRLNPVLMPPTPMKEPAENPIPQTSSLAEQVRHLRLGVDNGISNVNDVLMRLDL